MIILNTVKKRMIAVLPEESSPPVATTTNSPLASWN
jgi:hypothetical protein